MNYTVSFATTLNLFNGQYIRISAIDQTGSSAPDAVQTIYTGIPIVGSPAVPNLCMTLLSPNITYVTN